MIMLTQLRDWRTVSLTILAALLLAGCMAVAPATPLVAAESEPDSTTVDVEDSEVLDLSATASVMETEALLYMREEEKLARDVYLALYEQWGLPVFQNISKSESQHMEMVLRLLESRGLLDPAAGNGLGEFTNQELQALYDTLVAEGSQSQSAAVRVGATIEDVDIADLQSALASTTDDEIRLVFENLLRGSENHMRAFVRNLSRYGESYEPQYISMEDFTAIVQDANGPGTFRRGGGQALRGRWQQ